MTQTLRATLLLILLAGPAMAQTIVPVPRPTEEERAARAEAEPAPVEEIRPLTGEETASFMAQIRACWNTAALPPEAQGIGVQVAFTMTRDAEPIPNTFEMLSATVDDPDQYDLAFLAARRAVIRCGQGGYDLPAAAFPFWERVQITFDPTQDEGQ